MDSDQLVLLSLVIPTGAISGTRIVIDGITGKIQAYDAGNNLVVDIDANGIEALNPNGSFVNIFGASPASVINLQPANVGGHSFSPAALYSLAQLVAGREIAFLQLDSPAVDGNPATSIIMASSDDLGNPGYIDLIPDLGGDIRYRGRSLSRGLLAYQALTASDSARAAGVNTDMALAFTADATRLYEVTFKAQFGVGTLSQTYALDLSEGGTVGGNDGTAVDRLLRINTAESAVGILSRSVTIPYKPTAGAKTIRVRNDAGSGGTITLSADGGAAIGSRYFAIRDAGPR